MGRDQEEYYRGKMKTNVNRDCKEHKEQRPNGSHFAIQKQRRKALGAAQIDQKMSTWTNWNSKISQ